MQVKSKLCTDGGLHPRSKRLGADIQCQCSRRSNPPFPQSVYYISLQSFRVSKSVSLWKHVSTNSWVFFYLCAIAFLKTTELQHFCALLCDLLCRSSCPRQCWIPSGSFKFSIFFSMVSSTGFKLWNTIRTFKRWRQTFLLLSAKTNYFWKALANLAFLWASN